MGAGAAAGVHVLLVLGLRASFRIPTEIEANWPFRLAQPRLATCVNAAVLVMFTLAVVTDRGRHVVTAPLWPLSAVVTAAVLQALAGWMLVEIVLLGWTKVPFACAHAPSPDVLKSWWPVYIVAMYVYAFQAVGLAVRGPDLVARADRYLAAVAAVIAVVRVMRYRRLRHRRSNSTPCPPTSGAAEPVRGAQLTPLIGRA